MRVGTIISMPDGYTRFARVHDRDGMSYTVDPSELPDNTEVGDNVAYKLDLWSNDSGLAHSVKEK